jgi:hypothetical protein
MDDKSIFLLFLGIVTFVLICRITHINIHKTEGFGDPFAGIKKFFKKVSDTLADVMFFICYMGEVLKWTFKTVECMFTVFNPLYCPIIRIIDMLISFVGFIFGSVLRLFGLGIMVDAFNVGCEGINYLSKSAIGINLTDWHAWMGIDKKCYSCKFPPFPKKKKK